jgi:hypothetical protein
MVPILLAFWWLDAWLTDDGRAGWERNTVRNSLARFENDTKARVAIMGSSTSKDWLPESFLEQLLGLKRGDVIDAHINGCHQDCTWAEVQRIRQIHQQKRCRQTGKNPCDPTTEKRYRQVFFGTNLFQLCENAHSKRSLQHVMMTPASELPSLFGIYLHADQPLLWMGRYLGIRVSQVYGDTQALRDYWGGRFLGRPRAGKAIVLPVGISLLHVPDAELQLHDRRLPPRDCARPSILLDFALYVAFFPQLVAGPIVRAVDFLPQLDAHAVSARRRVRGPFLILRGLRSRRCIADNVASSSDAILRRPARSRARRSGRR